ncbi:hypothetical protein [Ralstonia solanacearum]|uniref:hypothetical protein n=1 Tax=Ralstonia solanacearum TaxID=305 RepID=UPI0018661D15|nr:hypothetical protein [Ralstonia solanacearum]QOK80956.1 hypothetical protein HF906_01440 [Ralstonia solanacearum]
MNKNSDGDTYFSLKEMVREVFLSAIEKKGFNAYQAFGYAYDEVEIIFLDGQFQNLCLLVALFFFAEKYGVEPLRDDLSFSMMLEELRLQVYNLEHGIGVDPTDSRLTEEEFICDLNVVKNFYL